MAGHEWSPGGAPLGTEMLWWRSLRPRLHAVLPAGTLLEIAPGFGRWTDYLIHECHELVGVDATERCVDACRERFDGSRARFSVNDGRTLPMVATASIDAVFSFDSLVHVDAPEIGMYLSELARCLKPGGIGFVHHSNLGAYADASTGVIPGYVTRKGWRAPSMSAHRFRLGCREAGLQCLSQEMVTWRIRGERQYRLRGDQLPLSDCFSVFRRPLLPGAQAPAKVYVNRHFVTEWDQITVLVDLYAANAGVAAAAPHAAPETSRARHVWRTARARVARAVLARRDPVVRPLRAGRCPDCSRPLVPADNGGCCVACDVTFMLA